MPAGDRLRPRFWPTLLGLAALAYLLNAWLGGNEPWLAVMLALPLIIGAIGWGWWAAERRGGRHARQARLLSGAIITLGQCKTDEEIYRALPVMLSGILDFTHAEVLRPAEGGLEIVAAHRWSYPEGFKVPLASVSGRAFQSSSWQYVPDTSRDPDFIRAPDAEPSRRELALPLLRHGRVVAVLNLESARSDSFTAGDRHALHAFAKIAEEALLRVSNHAALRQQIEERSSIAALNHKLLRAASAEEAAGYTLDELRSLLDYDCACIMVLRQGRFEALAGQGGQWQERQDPLAADAAVIPWQPGLLQSCWLERRPLFIDDFEGDGGCWAALPPGSQDGEPDPRSAAFVPISDANGDVQALLVLVPSRRTAGWSDKERRILTNAADTLGLALERAITNSRLRAMLDVIRQLAQTDDPSRLYQRTVEAATELVPDSEAASILVRSEDGFSFCGLYGCSQELLEAPPFSEEEMLAWYGEDLESFGRGVPRILRGDQVGDRSLETAGRPETEAALRAAGMALELRANLCVPISAGGEVVGILNLDSLIRDDAFDRTAVVLAEAFAQQIAVIIRQAQYRETLEKNALTDVLTGLGNRAGFNRRLEEELAGAKRHQHPFSLIVMDLNGFKAINDSLGHIAGDRALVRVAEALCSERRSGDSLYRWGGDEFAIVLQETDREGARLAAERYVRAIRKIDIPGNRLDASLGIASFPEDAQSSDGLLKRADDLMYQDKAVA